MTLRTATKTFVGKTARMPPFWLLYRSLGGWGRALVGIHEAARKSRSAIEIDPVRPWLQGGGSDRVDIAPIVHELFPSLTVANGPFRGMRYPSAEAAGSELLPKLLGSYESELHAVLAELLARNYTDVIDVGCAEGYYAVGFGLRLPKARIHAFDTDANARALCSNMAQLNGVGDRVTVGGACDESVLLGLTLSGRSLLISDCEGYEKELFTTAVVSFLARHDVLIETHDFGDIEISSVLRERFGGTHVIRAIESIDDIRKVRTYVYPELSRYDDATKLIALAERRPAIMEWLYLTPKTATAE